MSEVIHETRQIQCNCRTCLWKTSHSTRHTFHSPLTEMDSRTVKDTELYINSIIETRPLSNKKTRKIIWKFISDKETNKPRVALNLSRVKNAEVIPVNIAPKCYLPLFVDDYNKDPQYEHLSRIVKAGKR